MALNLTTLACNFTYISYQIGISMFFSLPLSYRKSKYDKP